MLVWRKSQVASQLPNTKGKALNLGQQLQLESSPDSVHAGPQSFSIWLLNRPDWRDKWVCYMSHYPSFFQFFGMNFCTSPRDVVFLLVCCLCSKWDFHLACLAILVPSLWFRETMWGFCHYDSFQVTASQLQIHALVFALRYWTGLCTRFSLQWTRC